MKIVKPYKLFLESYEEIMKNMVSDVDMKTIDKAEKEMEKLKNNIDIKKKELEDQLEKIKKLQLDTYTDDNKKLVEEKTKEIKETIDKLKEDITKYETEIASFKEKIGTLKNTK
jgi:chromosome segregation ATPase